MWRSAYVRRELLQSEERCRDASGKRSVVSEKAPVAIAFRRMTWAGE